MSQANQMYLRRRRSSATLRSEVQFAKLELIRANAVILREVAVVQLVARVRSMCDCVVQWLYAHYAEQATLRGETGSSRMAPNWSAFHELVGNADDTHTALAWYCNSFEDRFLLATLLYDVRASLNATSDRTIAQSMLARTHTSVDDAVAPVSPARFDEYWVAFLRALLAEMRAIIRNPRSAFYTPAPTADYLSKTFSHMLDQFYWEWVQSCDDTQIHHVLNGKEDDNEKSIRWMIDDHQRPRVAPDLISTY